MKLARLSLAALALSVFAAPAQADLRITVENVNEGGSFFFTPFWVALHNGGFDSYDGGTLASEWPGLTELAETGATGPISAAFLASPAGAAGGVDTTVTSVSFATDAPVLNPGERTTITMETGDKTVNRYFSYASMVIPSNDLFVANGNPFAHEIFDVDGNFLGPIVIDIIGSNDNGTEVNDASGGAAFSANGGMSASENVVIRNFFTDPGDVAYLASFAGSQTVTGFNIDGAYSEGDVIARITITSDAPESCPADLDYDGSIGFNDLLQLLSSWGPCP